MKISGNKPPVLQAYVRRTGEDEKTVRTKKSAPQSSGVDKVDLSTKAREKDVEKVRKILDKVPDVREEKVVALKGAIEEGTYKVNGEKIAQKMIKESIDEFV
jgi:negative regulator of flagellin synthesis FlgM